MKRWAAVVKADALAQAEAEATRAAAAKTRAESEEIALRTLARKLSLAIEAEQAMARGEMQGFLKVLRRLGKA